jgi:hypothetical protein
MGKLFLRRIYPMHRRWSAPFHKQLGKGTVAATDVKPSQARDRSKPVEEGCTHKLAHLPMYRS